MADDRANSHSPERRPVLVSSTSTSEPTSSGLSSLRHFSLGRTTSPSNLFSLTVPVRLDVLYVLINAARGGQCGLPLAPNHNGAQASFTTCHEPPAQCAVSCPQQPASCCVPGTGASIHQHPGGAQQFGAAPGGYGGHRVPDGGVLERPSDRHHWNSPTQRNGGNSGRPDYNQPHAAAGDWKRAQPHTGWRGNQRRGGEHGNGDRWRQDFDRDWGQRRKGSAESSFRKSEPQWWRREGLSFGSSAGSLKRGEERRGWENAQEAPEAKRCMFGVPESGWQKTLDSGVSAGFVGKAVDEDREDWEAEYESVPGVAAVAERALDASFFEDKSDSCKVIEDAVDEGAASAHPPKPELSTSPLPNGKDQAKEKVSWSRKEDKFLGYLKNFYSNMLEKSSSKADADLSLGLAVDPPKVDEEEWSPENVVGSPSGN